MTEADRERIEAIQGWLRGEYRGTPDDAYTTEMKAAVLSQLSVLTEALTAAQAKLTERDEYIEELRAPEEVDDLLTKLTACRQERLVHEWMALEYALRLEAENAQHRKVRAALTACQQERDTTHEKLESAMGWLKVQAEKREQAEAALTACRAQGEAMRARLGRCIAALLSSLEPPQAQASEFHSGCNSCGGLDGAHDAGCEYVTLLERRILEPTQAQELDESSRTTASDGGISGIGLRWLCKECGNARRRHECLSCGNTEPLTDEKPTPGLVR